MAEYTDAEKAIIQRDLEAGKIAPDLVPKARQVLGLTEALTPAPVSSGPLPSRISIDITKGPGAPSPALQTGATMRAATPAEVQAGEEVRRQERAQLPQRHELPPVLSWLPGAEMMSSPELVTMGAALGVNLLTTGAGATLGGVPGAVVGSGAGRALNKRLGLEEPGIMGDVLAYTAPLIPGGVKGAANLPKTLLRYSRAGRAMTAAEEATQAAREAWSAQTRDIGSRTGMARQAATEQAAQQTLEDRIKWAAATRQKQVEYARAAHQARQEAYQATQELQQAYATKRADVYQAALDKAKDAQATYRQAQQEYTAAVHAQQSGVERARVLPRQFLPQMPGRTTADIREDMRLLDAGGAEGAAVLRRLNVTTPQEALQKLYAEARTATELRTPTEVPTSATGMPSAADPYKTALGQWKVPLRDIPSEQLELQDFIKQQGGIKFADEELQGEFAALLSRRESGIWGLQNNNSGKTPQQFAEMAAERGFIPTADKQSLLDALHESVSGGRPVYSQYRLTPGELAASSAILGERPHGLPQTASAILYDRFAKQYGTEIATLTPANAAAQGVLQQFGQHFEALQPGRMQAIATEILASQHAPVSTVHQWLKDLGPLTRHREGTIRGAAKQLYAGLLEVMESIPGAPEALRQANRAARREFAVEDLERLVRRAVHTGNDGLPRLSAGPLIDRIARLGEEDPLFRGSFSATEWQTLESNLKALAGLPQIPPRVPRVPGNIVVKDIGPPPAPVAPKAVQEPRYAPFPAERVPGAVPEPRYPAYPPATDPRTQLHPLSLGRLGAEAVITGTELGMRGHVGPWGASMIALASADVAGYGLARLLLTPRAQPWLRKMITPSGTIDPRVLTVFSAAARLPWSAGATQLPAEEKK